MESKGGNGERENSLGVVIRQEASCRSEWKGEKKELLEKGDAFGRMGEIGCRIREVVRRRTLYGRGRELAHGGWRKM